MNTLTKEKLDYLTKLPFPEWAEDDALSDWQSELAELDGYLAGLASRALGGERPDNHMLVQNVRQLRSALEAITDLPAEDCKIRAECEAYMGALEDLAQSLIAD